MTVQYHSMRQNALVTATLEDDYVAELKEEWESLPYHNGFTNFEDFVIWVLSYNA